MPKLIAFLTIFLVSVYFSLSSAKASGNVAGSSAELIINQIQAKEDDYRILILRRFLTEHKSPLTPYSESFVRLADYYQIDWRMVPAISGVESTFGKRIPFKSYNAYGWAGGRFVFKSWPHSINIVSKTLREKYIEKGAVTYSEIARIYAPPSKTWGKNVNFFVNKISLLPLSFDI